MQVDDRVKKVRRFNLCMNCLRNDYFVRICKMGTYRKCSGRYNSLCHRPKVEGQTDEKPLLDKSVSEQTDRTTSDKVNNKVIVHHAVKALTRGHTLMATVNAEHSNGLLIPLHIILDNASEAHFITHTARN